jgi:radical SAM superfamily enzyme YgiQ (UPF0313 family)
MYHAWPILGVRAFSPPLGLLVLAGYLPEAWDVKLVDETIRPVTPAELAWADVVFVSGMHVQRRAIDEVLHRARAAGRLSVLGGPSVSACPEWYPGADLLHVGELGDATEALLARLDRDVSRPERQEVYRVQKLLPFDQHPLPAYRLIDIRDYMMGTVQSSSGCPFLCEFCDIPALYGRVPRIKPPQRVLAELDALLQRGNPGVAFLVDDNLIGNRVAAAKLLPELARWQKQRGYPLTFACEASLDLAEEPELLRCMREARFTIVFCGIETPEPEALRRMRKDQNLRRPIEDSVRVINSYGMQVVSGIIFGLDTDTEQSGAAVSAFVEGAGIPLLTMNVLQALPRTALWDRLSAAGRLSDDPTRGSQVRFLRPEEAVYGTWRECMAQANRPEAILDRLDRQFEATFRHRIPAPATRARVTPANLWRGLRALTLIFWGMGVRAPYRRRFWKTALPALRGGFVEELIEIATIAHHAIAYTEEVTAGQTAPGLHNPTPETPDPGAPGVVPESAAS